MKKVDTTLAKLVVDEATKLKKTATESELERLSVHLNDLAPNNQEKCIYGQMTGHCFNARANELVLKCAKRVYDMNRNYGDNSFKTAELNGKPKPVNAREISYFSPIEMYIYLTKSKKGTRALLEYIKGMRKKLEVKDLYKRKKVLVG